MIVPARSLTRQIWLALLAAAAISSGTTGLTAWISVRHLLTAELDASLDHHAVNVLGQPGPPPGEGRPRRMLPGNGPGVPGTNGAGPAPYSEPPRLDLEPSVIVPAPQSESPPLHERGPVRRPGPPPHLGPMMVAITPAGDAHPIPDQPWPDGLPTVLATDDRVVPLLEGRYRALQRRRSDGMVVLVVASTAALAARLHDLAWILIAITLVVIAVAAAAAGILGRALRFPLRAIDTALTKADPGEPRPLMLPHVIPTEFAGLTARINDYQARLVQIREHERRMISGLAHELRTPLAGMRVHLERAGALDSTSAPALAVCLAELTTAQDRAGALLQLARLESGRDVPRMQAVSPVELLADAWARHLPVAAARGCTLAVDAPPEADLAGDPHLLATIFSNLIGNAVIHGGPGSIAVTALVVGDRWQMTMRNPLPSVRRPHGSGIGLTLVQAIARAHGATVRQVVDGGEFSVLLDWPIPGKPEIDSEKISAGRER